MIFSLSKSSRVMNLSVSDVRSDVVNEATSAVHNQFGYPLQTCGCDFTSNPIVGLANHQSHESQKGIAASRTHGGVAAT